MNNSTLAFSGLNALGFDVRSNSVVSQAINTIRLVKSISEILFNF